MRQTLMEKMKQMIVPQADPAMPMWRYLMKTKSRTRLRAVLDITVIITRRGLPSVFTKLCRVKHITVGTALRAMMCIKLTARW